MVNPGRPSTGCFLCRKKKVKCDGQRPQCMVCMSSQRPCPGYKDDTDIFFRDQNGFAQRKVEKRIAKRQNAAKEIPRLRINTMKLPPPLQLNGLDSLTQCFYTQYVHSKGVVPIMNFLPELSERSSVCPILRDALTAAAIANAANQLHMPELLRRARCYYGKGLRGMQTRLNDKSYLFGDEVIPTIMLFGVYEMITLDKPTDVAWVSHVPGATAIVELRGYKNIQASKLTNSALVNLYFQQLIESFVSHTNPSLELLKWAKSTPDTLLGSCYGLFSDMVIHYLDIQKIISRAEDGLAMSNKLLDILETSRKMNLQAATLHTRFLQTSLPKIISNPQSSSDASADIPKHLIICHADQAISISSMFDCARIHLIEATLLALRRLRNIDPYASPDLDDLEIRLLTTLRYIVDDICASIPFLLDEVDSNGIRRSRPKPSAIQGYMQIWQLRCALNAETTSPRRRDWIRSRLKFIGHVLGLKFAYVIANTADAGPNAPQDSHMPPYQEVSWGVARGKEGDILSPVLDLKM